MSRSRSIFRQARASSAPHEEVALRKNTRRPPRFVAIPLGDEGRFVWSFAWRSGEDVSRGARVLRRALRRAQRVAGIVIDLGKAGAAPSIPASVLLELAGEIQRRGIGVVAIGAAEDLLIEISMGDSIVRLPLARDLTEALDAFRRFEEIGERAWTMLESARAVRAPARAGSVAPLCRALWRSLEEHGVPSAVGESVVEIASAILWKEVLPACDPSRDRISLCASVRGSNLTVTILDSGRGTRPAGQESTCSMRIHRFRVLESHHATVLEPEDARLHSEQRVR
jgi:hypothetical protein